MSYRYTLVTESEKQEFNEKQKETKMVCHCGGKFTKENKNKHCLTKKHINYLATITNMDEYINSSLMLECKKR
jgi:hypothetical protein